MKKYYKKVPAVSEADNFRRRKLSYLLILIIFSIFLFAYGGFQSNPYAQEQWRVFTTQNSQLPTNIVGPLTIDTNNVKWIGTILGLVKIDGNNWQIYDTSNTPLGDSRISPEAIDIYNDLWIIVYGKGIAKYDGINWTIFDTNNSGIASNSIADIKIDKNNIKWIGTNKGLVKYNDTTWVTYDTVNSGLPDNFVKTLMIEDSVLWIGHFTISANFGLTKFDGTNWTIYNILNSGLPSGLIGQITVDFMNNKWIATSFGGLAKFNTLFNNWTVYNSTNSGLPENNLYSVLTDGNKKWIGTQGSGLTYYNDTSWLVYTTSNSPLPSNAVFNIDLDRDKNLWICTAGGLVIYNPVGIIGIYNIQRNHPLDFLLYQNYPNPFNPQTNISYELRVTSYVTVQIYDITGKLITDLVKQKQNAGKHVIIWDASAYPSGVYFYKLDVDNYSLTKKMVLVK